MVFTQETGHENPGAAVCQAAGLSVRGQRFSVGFEVQGLIRNLLPLLSTKFQPQCTPALATWALNLVRSLHGCFLCNSGLMGPSMGRCLPNSHQNNRQHLMTLATFEVRAQHIFVNGLHWSVLNISFLK